MRVEQVDANAVKEKFKALKSGKPKVSARDRIRFLRGSFLVYLKEKQERLERERREKEEEEA